MFHISSMQTTMTFSINLAIRRLPLGVVKYDASWDDSERVSSSEHTIHVYDLPSSSLPCIYYMLFISRRLTFKLPPVGTDGQNRFGKNEPD